MERQLAERNLKLYYFFQLFKEPLFWGPILITFIQRVSGMSLSDIYFMEAVCLLGIMFLQVPTGALADLLGRKTCILIGLTFLMGEGIIFALASSPWMVWTANSLWAVGFSLISGADTSLLYDSLKLLGREEEYKKIEGRSTAYRLAVASVASVSTGYLAVVNLRLPFFCGVVFFTFCLVFACFFHEPPRFKKEVSWRNHWELMKVSALFVKNHAKVKWVIAFVVLIGVISKAWFFTYNPYFELVELPLVYYGWLFFALNIVAAVTSHEADWLARKLGDLGSIVVMFSLVAIPILLMGTFVSKAAVLLVLCQNVTRGYITPWMGHFLHRYLDSENRATVMSINGGVRGLGEFLMLSSFGAVVGIFSLPTSLQLLGLFTVIAGLILVVFYRRIFTTAV